MIVARADHARIRSDHQNRSVLHRHRNAIDDLQHNCGVLGVAVRFCSERRQRGESTLAEAGMLSALTDARGPRRCAREGAAVAMDDLQQ